MITHWRLIAACSALVGWIWACYWVATRLQTLRRRYPKIKDEPFEWWK